MKVVSLFACLLIAGCSTSNKAPRLATLPSERIASIVLGELNDDVTGMELRLIGSPIVDRRQIKLFSQTLRMDSDATTDHLGLAGVLCFVVALDAEGRVLGCCSALRAEGVFVEEKCVLQGGRFIVGTMGRLAAVRSPNSAGRVLNWLRDRDPATFRNIEIILEEHEGNNQGR